MKTAGELLREKREQKELDLATVANKTKVKVEYLEAIESSNFASLPSETTTKGFLRNYAHFLRLNPDTVVAMFRRDFESKESGEIIPRGLVEPVVKKPHLISANSILIFTSLVVFFTFLGFQLFSLWSLPKLDIIQPENGEVYGEKVTVKGVTDKDATLRINQQQVLVDQNGQFTLDLLFSSGTHSVTIEAVNRRGKSKLVERTFQVSK